MIGQVLWGGGGGTVEVLRPLVASGHLEQICPRNGVQGLQDRVHGKTADYVEGMVDSYGLPRGGSSTTTEHLRTFEGLKSVRNVGDLYRFKRRLLSRGRGTRVYQVFTLRLQRQSLRVPGAPLRSVDGSQSLHKDREGYRGLPQSTRCRYAPVLGRLADEKSDPGSPEYVLFPSERRILRATRLAASLLARTAQPAKTWQRFLGHLSSLRELVPMAVVHTRPI